MLLFLFNYFLSVIELLNLLIQINKSIFLIIKNSLIYPEKKSVKNEVVVITGGAKGLGRELALEFFNLGAKVIILDRDNITGNDLVNSIIDQGGSSFFHKVDVSQYEQVKKVFNFIQAKHQVAILINNAGVCNNYPLTEISSESITNTIGTNLLGHFWTVKCALPKMLEAKKGHIVAIASNFGLLGRGSFTDYTASKFGVVGFMESLEDELKEFCKHNIKFTTVCPAAIETGFTKTIDTRFPRLLPIMQPQFAAKKIVDSILRNEQFVIIPKGYSILYKTLIRLPRTIRHLIIEYIGSTAQPNHGKNYK